MNSISTYHFVFIAISLISICFFAFRQKVDPLLVGLLSSLIYFSPGFLGEIGFAYGAPAGDYRSAIEPAVYVVMSIVLVSLVFAAALLERFNVHRDSATHVNLPFLSHTLAGVAVIGLMTSISTVGKGYLCIEKTDVLARLDGWYYIAAYAAPLVFACGLAVRAWGAVLLASLMLLADLFVGFRAGVSVALIAFCLLSGHWLWRGGKKRIAFLLIVLIAGVGLFVVKQLAWNIKYAVSVPCEKLTSGASRAQEPEAGGATSGRSVAAPVDGVAVANEMSMQVHSEQPSAAGASATTPVESIAVENAGPIQVRLGQLSRVAALLTDGETYVSAFRYAEPMVTQAILNEVVKNGFRTPPGYVVDHLLSGVPGGKTLFGIDVAETPSFNETFQKALFPLATFGMASNPWAQAYSAGGYAMVGVFALVYSLLLAGLTLLFFRFEGPIRGVVVVLSGWWGFYVHRNEVLIEIGIIKTVIYILLVALFISVSFMFAKRKFFRSENR